MTDHLGELDARNGHTVWTMPIPLSSRLYDFVLTAQAAEAGEVTELSVLYIAVESFLDAAEQELKA